MRFQDKTVFVTGSSSGIGKATAKRFSDEGAQVFCVDVDEDEGRASANELPQDRTEFGTLDIADRDACADAMAACVDRFGGIDVIVANAGIAMMGDVTQVDPADFDKVIANNVTGTYNTIKSGWDAVAKAKGCVVATASVSGLKGDEGAFAYNTSKAAIANMVRAMGLDYGRTGVRVNAIAPGFTDTELTDGMGEEIVEGMHRRIPMGRAGKPEEMAAVAAFLASEDASYVNGAVWLVDGGLSASTGQPPIG